MRRRPAPVEVDLGTLLGWSPAPETVPAPGKLSALARLICLCLLAALGLATVIAPGAATALLTAKAGADYWESLPSTLPTQPVPTRSIILAADGTRIAQFFSENRVPVRIGQVASVMKKAIVDIEDSRFYEHTGVDFRGTGRALVNNLMGGSTQGGSTITQQYVKNVLLSAADDDQTRAEVTSRSSYMRKLREAKLAIETEKRMSKEEILEGYLNIAYFGDGAYGVGTAAQHYFSRSVSDLSLPEAAMLAGLVKNPTGYNPVDHPRAARERRDVVLARMVSLGHITTAQYDQATSQKVRLKLSNPANGCVSSRYPFWCQWIKQELTSDPAFGATAAQRNERLYRGGMVITTTLDRRAQAIAQQAVDQEMGRSNRVAASAVTVEPGTGNVVAMAVNRTFGTPTKREQRKDPFRKTEVLLPLVPAFQPGSNFKPFTLAAALERGFDPDTRITAPSTYTPIGLSSPPGGFENSGSAEAGTFDAATALARSSNTWFVKLEEQVGVLNVASMAERLGITSLPRTGPRAITARDASLTLGAYEVSPVEMAGAYATFAAHGIHCTPTPFKKILGPDGAVVPIPDTDCHQAIPESVADTVAQIMTKVIDGPDPYRTGINQSIGRPAAGKTGTTQGNAAVWFSGYTPQYATSVAVMDPRGGYSHPLVGFYAGGRYISKAYGGLVAGPIWSRIMKGIHQGLPVERFRRPAQTVVLGTVVPDVRGLTIDAAYRALQAAGYEVRVAAENGPRDPAVPPDVIIAQVPAPAVFLGLGETVTMTLSAGSTRNFVLPSD